MDTNALNNFLWEHSIEMYAKWGRIGGENAKRMMQMHRDRFPQCAKVFDQIDAEINLSLVENNR